MCALAPAAHAAPSLAWSTPVALGGTTSESAVSCASESLCVAVDEQGDAFVSSNPTEATPTWSRTALRTEGSPLTGVSCAPDGPCVAVDGHGQAFTDPQPGSSQWSSALDIDGTNALAGVSCASASLCVAVDGSGDVLSSTDPGSSDWSSTEADPGRALTGVSCPSASLCVAVDDAGVVLASATPASGGWHAQRVDFEALRAVSCASASACVAVDADDNALASSDPGASSATWSITPVGSGRQLAAISCASTGLCAAVGAGGEALASDDAATLAPEWPGETVDGGGSLTGVSCLPGGFCLALDVSGHSLSARVPAPRATTLEPPAAELTSTSATLEGEVDPNDAALGACSFEYASGTSGIQSIPCATLPPAIGTSRVSAKLTGLAPNTAYRYRIIATAPAGTGAGAEVTFTTPVSASVALVTPNPSITGTPAVNQRLTCHPGTPAGSSAQLTYAWLRDQIPIAGSTSSTYTVKGQDSGQHLQCQVTATDGGGSATQKSAFVTIPVGGAPASAGETSVGSATFKDGKVSVPIGCSAQASRGCQVTVRVSVVETLSGNRVLALAARARRIAHRSAAALRHVTLALASARAHLGAGVHASVSAVLTRAAKRLLASRRRFTANVSVSGTVIGVIEAQLAQQLVTLSASSGHAAGHAARRRRT